MMTQVGRTCPRPCNRLHVFATLKISNGKKISKKTSLQYTSDENHISQIMELLI